MNTGLLEPTAVLCVAGIIFVSLLFAVCPRISHRMGRTAYFRLASLFTLTGFASHCMACFGMSVMEHEFTSMPWSQSATVIAGVRAFSRSNVSIPEAEDDADNHELFDDEFPFSKYDADYVLYNPDNGEVYPMYDSEYGPQFLYPPPISDEIDVRPEPEEGHRWRRQLRPQRSNEKQQPHYSSSPFPKPDPPQKTPKPASTPTPSTELTSFPVSPPTCEPNHPPTSKPSTAPKWVRRAGRARVAMTWKDCASAAEEGEVAPEPATDDPFAFPPKERWQVRFVKARGFEEGCALCAQSGRAILILMTLAGACLLPQLVSNCLRQQVLEDNTKVKFRAIFFSFAGSAMTAAAAVIFMRFCSEQYSSREPKQMGLGWCCACASAALQFLGIILHSAFKLPTYAQHTRAKQRELQKMREHKGYGHKGAYEQLNSSDPDGYSQAEARDPEAPKHKGDEEPQEEFVDGNTTPVRRGGRADTSDSLGAAVESDTNSGVSAQKARTSVVRFLQKDGKHELNVAKQIVKVWRSALELQGEAASGKGSVERPKSYPPVVRLRMSLHKELGLMLGHETLRVHHIAPGGQACKLGVRNDWHCETVGGRPVSTLQGLSVVLNDLRARGEEECDLTFNTEGHPKKKKKSIFSRFSWSSKKKKPSPMDATALEDIQRAKVANFALAMINEGGEKHAETRVWQDFFEAHYFQEEGTLEEFTQAMNKEVKRQEKKDAKREAKKKKTTEAH